MKTQKIYFLAIFLFAFCSFSGQDSLSQYLTLAAENNPGLKAKFNSYMASMEKVNQVGTLPDPQIAFGYFIQPVETRLGPQQAKLSLSQMFPWFGLLAAKEDVATEMAKGQYEQFEQSKTKLFFEVKRLYFQIYFISRSQITTQENIDLLEMLQRLAIVTYESGKSSFADELRVEMEINDLNYQLHKLEDVKQLFTVEMNNLLNREVTSPIIVPEKLEADYYSIDKETILDSISKSNHLIKQLEHRILSWQKQDIVAKKSGTPNFMVGVDYIFIGKNDMITSPDNGKDALLLPKVSFSIPLYRKKYNSMIEEARLSLDASTYEKEDKLNELSSLLEKNYIDLHDAQDRTELYEKQIKLAQQSLDLLTTDYTTNGGKFEELLRLENKLLNYQLAIEKAGTDAKIALAFIDYLTGK